MRETALEPTEERGRGTVCSRATLAELEDLLGRDHVMRLLHLLVAEIRSRFRAENADRITIGQDAHALLASSETLGFFELSRCCSAIERACLNGGDIHGPLEKGRIAAQHALDALTALGAYE